MSYPEILLVSEDKLKSFTTINFNLSPDDLQPYVFDAQQIYLQNYLGASYLNALKTRVYNGTTTSADTTLLDDYIGPMLCNWALYMALPTIKYRVYNKGVLSGTSENAETIELNELQFLMNQVKNIAENYTRRMQEHLQYYSSDYPEYNSPDIAAGQLPDKANNYNNNLVIPHYPYAAKQRILRNARYNGGGYYSGGYYSGIDCYNLPNSGN
jgi:hypothetical protein